MISKSCLFIATTMLLHANMLCYSMEDRQSADLIERQNARQLQLEVQNQSNLSLSDSGMRSNTKIVTITPDYIIEVYKLYNVEVLAKLLDEGIKLCDWKITELRKYFRDKWKIDDNIDLYNKSCAFNSMCEEVYDGSFDYKNYEKEKVNDILSGYIAPVDQAGFFSESDIEETENKIKELEQDMIEASGHIKDIQEDKTKLLDLSCKIEKEMKTSQE